MAGFHPTAGGLFHPTADTPAPRDLFLVARIEAPSLLNPLDGHGGLALQSHHRVALLSQGAAEARGREEGAFMVVELKDTS
jgi:hypothetical protein